MARRRTTLKDVAEAVGVHISTVSRALNPATRPSISPQVVTRILAAVERLNYRPNAAAYSLRTRKTHIVGVVIPDIANSVFPPIIRGIEDTLSQHGYMVILVNTSPRNPKHAAVVDALLARGVDGLIVASVQSNDQVIQMLAEQDIPLVTVNRRADDPRVPSVVHDADEGIRLLLEHLHALGHRRVVNISPPLNISTGKSRHAAFERYRLAMGFDPAPELVIVADALTEGEGERCAALALDKIKGFTAILASNDRLALGAIDELHRQGYVCPDDISVAGFNDMPIVSRIEPPLTTIRVRLQETGRRAAEILLKRMNGGTIDEAERHVVMPVELVVRKSTGKVRVPRKKKRGKGR